MPVLGGYRAWGIAGCVTAAVARCLRHLDRILKQAEPHAEPRVAVVSGCNLGARGWTCLNAIRVLQSTLENAQHSTRLQIHDKVWTSCKYPIRALSQPGCNLTTTFILSLHHAESLCLQRVPWAPTNHALVGEIADGINALTTNGRHGFV
jgi:hypothetical protein